MNEPKGNNVGLCRRVLSVLVKDTVLHHPKTRYYTAQRHGITPPKDTLLHRPKTRYYTAQKLMKRGMNEDKMHVFCAWNLSEATYVFTSLWRRYGNRLYTFKRVGMNTFWNISKSKHRKRMEICLYYRQWKRTVCFGRRRSGIFCPPSASQKDMGEWIDGCIRPLIFTIFRYFFRQSLPNGVLNGVQSSVSSLTFQYPLSSLRSSNSCVSPPPGFPVTSLLPSVFSSITWYRK